MHRSIYLTSANSVSATVYDWADNITGFFTLRENNDDLNRRNAELQAEVARLKATVNLLQEEVMAEKLVLPDNLRPYDFIVAHVIKNSVMKADNYLTINKGSDDGVLPEMGVIDQNGVVGIVNVVGPHSARVISLLNPNFRLSCKIKNNNNFGSLVWDGKDPRFAILEELPRHAPYKAGDTLVTSGYSAVFPDGIPVGVIEKQSGKNVDPDAIKIRLLTDFATLNNVQVVVNYMAEELSALEAEKDSESHKK